MKTLGRTFVGPRDLGRASADSEMSSDHGPIEQRKGDSTNLGGKMGTDPVILSQEIGDLPARFPCSLRAISADDGEDMQELGFGLAVYQVKELVHRLAKTEGREHLMSDKTEVASKCIPLNRHVVLFTDSHNSHVIPEVIELACEQQIFLLTFPPHTIHLLQPLDVGVYRALKCNWSKQLNSYTKKHPDKKLDCRDFYELFNPAFAETSIAQTIQNSFKRSGTIPLNKSSISIESQAPIQTH
ncbi:hypothetical protein PR048_006973 [Dryococelus australis]|uniref:DDE-1 domain-containing protein n=1 Tax=Dryococelus australis TaxID=614101 RepID=A0ABQ9ICD9_9NEOP|nr:hypothetical protein PR048_006973 [Dryococelus australis]